MKTVAAPDVPRSLLARLGSIDIESTRRWGTLTPYEMLWHLGDANAMVLGLRPRKGTVPDARPPRFCPAGHLSGCMSATLRTCQSPLLEAREQGYHTAVLQAAAGVTSR